MAIVVLSPVLIVVAILVRIKLGSPVLFKQNRPGLNEKIFTLYKFRTMTDAKDEKGTLLPDGERLTKFGKMLRATSLDELPELWNILKGDMSVVGPRPLLVEYLPLYNESQKRRHEVKPGLSGLSQISGRNAVDWEDKFKLDVQYAEKVSFIGDWKIILLTIKKVLTKEGIHSESSATMEAFSGINTDKLIIVGASGHGKVVADIAIKMKQWQSIAFLDDDESIKTSMGIEVIGKTADAIKYKDEADFFIGIGENRAREKVQNKLEEAGLSIVSLIHPSAIIGLDVEIKIGTIVMAGSVINSSSKIGKGCILNTSCSIDHDMCLKTLYMFHLGLILRGK